MLCVHVTRSQSNLAKAASNGPHTLHMLESLAIADLEICSRYRDMTFVKYIVGLKM